MSFDVSSEEFSISDITSLDMKLKNCLVNIISSDKDKIKIDYFIHTVT